ncbi:MAG: HAD-IIIC family phosphatase [Actinomycetota bacterium]
MTAGRRAVALAATFTTDALVEPFERLSAHAEEPLELRRSPYGQTVEELANPASSFAGDAVARVLVHRSADLDPGSTAGEFVGLVRDFVARSPEPLFVVETPGPEACSRADAGLLADVVADTAAIELPVGRLPWLYDIETIHDPIADQLANVPYTQAYFEALATTIYRAVHVRVARPKKVIALDCDGTLWDGVCAEVGADGVDITDEHRAFQQRMVEQSEAGRLLCLVSKNIVEDLDRVFESRPDMVLRREHLVTSRIGWQPKSESLRSISDELSLALDSFVFVDDSAVECAEVATAHPGVVTVRFPAGSDERSRLVDSTWAFDVGEPTADDRHRAHRYRAEMQRRELAAASQDFETFLAELDVRVRLRPLGREDVARGAQLAVRTNQFATTRSRPTAAELTAQLDEPSVAREFAIVDVADRLGEYGDVGLLDLSWADQLTVNQFCLSCRVLNRRAEHRVVDQLAELAGKRRVSEIVFPVHATDRNEPARRFLDEVDGIVASGVRVRVERS